MKNFVLIGIIVCAASLAHGQCQISVTTTGVISGVGTISCGLGAQVFGLENVYCSKGTAPELTEGTPLWGVTDDIATLPTHCMYTGTDATPSPGNIYTPASSVTLTNIFTSAGCTTITCAVNSDGTTSGTPMLHLSCGDVILLTAGTTYVGEFEVPNLPCDGLHWITIKSTGVANALFFPTEGTRATPCDDGKSNDGSNGRQLPGYPDYPCPFFPTVLSAKVQQGAGSGSAALNFLPGANHYRFIGLEIAKNPAVSVDQLVQMTSDGQVIGGNHIIFDRITCHGDAWTPAIGLTNESQNCIQAKNSNWIALINSWGYDTYCIASCIDSHIFSGGTGLFQDGPFKLYNNMITSAGESWIWGGGGQGAGTPNTRDVEIRSNHSFKPLSWMVPINGCAPIYSPVTKNNGEFKNMTFALVEGNVYENNWQGCQSDQTGFAQLLDPVSQNNHLGMLVNFNGTNVVTVADSHSFTHNQNTSPISGNPVDPVNCPPGGCILEDTPNNVDYRFCNGANGCDQSGIPNQQCGTGANAGNACTTNAQCPLSYCAPTTTARICNPAQDPNCVTTTTPVASGEQINACVPGDCPSCKNTDITFRYNEIYNFTHGLQVNNSLSSVCRDQAAGMNRVSIHDNLAHGLSKEMSNGDDAFSSSQFIVLSNNSVPPGVLADVHAIHNTFAIETGDPATASGFGSQNDRTDIEYMSGLVFKDNVGPAAWGVQHTSGSNVTKGVGANPGLANTYQTDACQRYFANEAPAGTINTAGIQNFTFAGTPTADTNYFVTRNGQFTAITAQTATSFSVTAATGVGDTITVRDLNACNFTFASNLMGACTLHTNGCPANFQGVGTDQTPYPNEKSCGAGNSQECILDESAVPGIFTGIFVSWGTGRDGDYHIKSTSQYFGTASDSLTRAGTGTSPGADFTVLGLKTVGVRSAAFIPALTITTTSLPGGTHGVAYNSALQASNGASQFWHGYKGWFLETNPANCAGNCGSLNNGASHSGIVISRSGIVNGPLALLTVSRTGCPAACVSNYVISQTITSNIAGNPGGFWEVGQTVTGSGMVNGSAANNLNDGTFNGTCTITAVTSNGFSCALTNGVNTNIASHNPNTAKTCGVKNNSFCDANVAFAPIAIGTYTFWVGARDGAFQTARAQVTITIN